MAPTDHRQSVASGAAYERGIGLGARSVRRVLGYAGARARTIVSFQRQLRSSFPEDHTDSRKTK